MIKDTLVDWLKIQQRRGTRGSPAYTKSNGFIDFIMNQGVRFEDKLVSYIHKHRHKVTFVADTITDENCARGIELMKKGVPVLHSVPVKNEKEHTQGIIDLLIRSDYLDKIMDTAPLGRMEMKKKAPHLSGNYHYVVVDIKFSTLMLRADAIHLLNSKNLPFYKAQCWIYTQAVGEIQGYQAPYAFIMGRRWTSTSRGVTTRVNECLSQLGRICYKSVDKDIPGMTKKAIDWVRDVRQNGEKWTIYPPCRPELYPNMCVDSGMWAKEKEIIAERIAEITSVWQCGVKHRGNAHGRGIMSWRDADCNAATLGMGPTRGPIVNAILDINRQKKEKIRPQKITKNLYEWKRYRKNEMFIDFETISDVFTDFSNLPLQESTDMIFMIGAGWTEKGKWRYRTFVCSELSREAEYEIMDDFATFMRKKKYPKMFYWHAEKTLWTRAENRQGELANRRRRAHIADVWDLGEWADMADLFRSVPIVVRDCFKYSLKHIARAMFNHGLISVNLDTDCDSGMTAMVNAWKCYQRSRKPKEDDVMKDIVKYNEFDCKVLWDILMYLRSNHK